MTPKYMRLDSQVKVLATALVAVIAWYLRRLQSLLFADRRVSVDQSAKYAADTLNSC